MEKVRRNTIIRGKRMPASVSGGYTTLICFRWYSFNRSTGDIGAIVMEGGNKSIINLECQMNLESIDILRCLFSS